MPDGFDAVIINTQFIAPTEPTDLSGKTLIIGAAPEGTEPSIEYFNTYEELIEKYSFDLYTFYVNYKEYNCFSLTISKITQIEDFIIDIQREHF